MAAMPWRFKSARPHFMFFPSYIPKNWLSHLFGKLATVKIPIWSSLFRDVFCKLYSLDESEMLQPISSYPTLQKLFTRRIKSEARLIATEALVSPVDGKVSQKGDLNELSLIQAKGKTYDLEGLLGDAERAESFRGGKWATIYLAPFNYHRIHSPVTGKINKAIYIPGNLWPVNVKSVGYVDKLFNVNERMTSFIDTGKGKVALVKVGALNVGRITLAYTDHFIANLNGKKGDGIPREWIPQSEVQVTKGGDLGCFELGSTVILIADREFLANHPESFKTPVESVVRMGQAF